MGRICNRCRKEKTADAFSPNGRAGLYPICRVCKRDDRLKNYDDNPEPHRARARAYRAEHPEQWRAADQRSKNKRYDEFVAFLAKVKDAPCVDCKHKFPPCVMDFDHVRGKKKFGIGTGHTRPRADVLKEIKKCDLVCANCHRIRTWITRGRLKRWG